MADTDVPGEGDGFGGAFDGDGANTSAVADVFNGDELCPRVAVGLVEAGGGGVVGRAEARAVELVAQCRGQHGVGLRVGVEVVPDFAVYLIRLDEYRAADFKSVVFAEMWRGLLLDTDDAHAVADFRLG